MNKVGICGIRGQLGNQIRLALGDLAVEVTRDGNFREQIETLIWAAGSSGNRTEAKDTLTELAQLKKTLNRIDFADIRQVVLVSSGGTVYGSHSEITLNEDSPLNPNTPYGVMKVKIEEEFQSLSKSADFKLSILRLANVYSLEGKSLIKTLVNCAQKKVNFAFTVHPNSTKQYGHASDYANSIVDFVRTNQKQSKNMILNIFSPYSYSIREIVNFASTISDFPISNSIQSLHLPLETISLTSKYSEYFTQQKPWMEMSWFFDKVKRGET